ncbi:MAG: hypothetical protein K5978_00425 [Campylobacter sp.]|nr:hypothetical protein [Campylobacter sp.]
MKTILFTFLIGIFLSGCLFVNERGISTRYYNDCKEYYDANGTYHKGCPHNVIDWN